MSTVPPAFPVPPPPLVPSAALAWAERYAAIGMPSIAIRSNDKRPLAEGWQAATLADTSALLTANPGANLGIAVPPGLVVLDVDVKNGTDGFAVLKAFEFEHGPLPPTLRAKTASGGAHLWFKVQPGVNIPNRAGIAPGLDVRSGGKGFVVVAPSTINGARYEWENFGEPIADAPEGLLRAMLARKPAETEATGEGEPPHVPQGQRNNVLFERASTMRAAGLSAAVILAALSELNRESCVPPLDLEEVRTIAESASKYARGPVAHEVFAGDAPLPAGASLEKPAAAEWSVVSLDVPAEAFEPVPHIVDRWIPQGEVTLFAGHGGHGKSYIALSMAVHVAIGRPFGPLPVHQAHALFYSAEDGAKVLQRRLVRICQHLGIAPAGLRGKLTLLDASDVDPTLFRNAALPMLDRLRDFVIQCGAALIIVDNGSDAFDGDEIKRSQVRAFMRTLRTWLARPGRAVLLLAHIDKDSARRGGKAGDAEDYSGSTAWHNSSRSRLSLKPGANDDSLVIEHAKANHGPKAAPVHLHWHEGMPIASNSVPLDHVARAEHRERQKQAIRDTIGKIEGRGGHVPAARGGPNTTHKAMKADATFPADVDRDTLYQLLDELQDAGLIYRKEMRTSQRNTVWVYSCCEK